jgi:hypothetical protein
MGVRFDTDSGRLRMDDALFRELTVWAAGGEAAAESLSALRGAGVIEHGRPHSAVAPGLDAVTDPLCRLTISLRHPDGHAERGDGWVNGAAAAFLLDLPDGEREFGVVHPTFLPAALARIVALGPRPRVAVEPVRTTPELVEELMAAHPDRRAAAAARIGDGSPTPELAEATRALTSPPRRHWAVTVAWRSPDGRPAGRDVEVLDKADGLWLVERYPGQAMLWPTTPTAVWRMLVRLLPQDPEMG